MKNASQMFREVVVQYLACLEKNYTGYSSKNLPIVPSVLVISVMLFIQLMSLNVDDVSYIETYLEVFKCFVCKILILACKRVISLF